MAAAARCPVCAGEDTVETVRRETLPAMQNYVHRTRESALAAPRGRFVLVVCRTCGFAWNDAFDPSKLVYDEGYDNAVPSAVMAAYYVEIVGHLARRYDLEDGLVVDVGCGNGAFLVALAERVPDARGLGVDPALEASKVAAGGRVALVKDVFGGDSITERPALVVSRHVLEHMPRPVEFLAEIRSAVARFDPVPVFFEVPDLRWILEHDAFWDFCYEHCNYFAEESLGEAVRRAGFAPTTTNVEFGAQYRWQEALAGGARVSEPTRGSPLADALRSYADRESERIVRARERLRSWRNDGRPIAVWGMATKGVLFSVLVDPDAALIDACIDVNENKHGCFVPVSGHSISPPATLRGAAGERRLVVVVMNENYADEIKSACADLGLRPTFAGVSGDVL